MTVLEGFETFAGGLPDTLDWADNGSASTITQTTSHVTEGTYSCRLQVADGSADFFNISTGSGSFLTDLTGYSSISIDVYVDDVPTDGWIIFSVFDLDENLIFDTTTEGTTGAFTLNIDLGSLTSPDRTTIIIRSQNSADPTAYDTYVDNLVGVGGSSTAVPVFMNHLRTQGIS